MIVRANVFPPVGIIILRIKNQIKNHIILRVLYDSTNDKIIEDLLKKIKQHNNLTTKLHGKKKFTNKNHIVKYIFSNYLFARINCFVIVRCLIGIDFQKPQDL